MWQFPKYVHCGENAFCFYDSHFHIFTSLSSTISMHNAISFMLTAFNRLKINYIYLRSQKKECIYTHIKHGCRLPDRINKTLTWLILLEDWKAMLLLYEVRRENKCKLKP